MIFANKNIPEKRSRLCLAEHEISDLPEDSKKIFRRNMLDWYIDRSKLISSNSKFAVLDAFCFAEFSRYFYLPSNPKYKENDYQSEELDDEIVEDISKSDYLCPKDIKLLSNDKMKCRKTPYVLKCFVPNKETKPEEYAHHMLLMYYPFKNEKKLLSGNPPTYASKLSEPEVIDLVNQNYSLVEPFATVVDNAFLRLGSDMKNDEVNGYLTEDIGDSESEAFGTMKAHSADVGNNDLMSHKLPAIPDNIINENMRSLNMKQREVLILYVNVQEIISKAYVVK